MIRQRILRMFIALDQALWCWITLGYYGPDETLSACAWRWQIEGSRMWPRRVIDALFWPLERDHCLASFEAEQVKAHLPDAYRRAT